MTMWSEEDEAFWLIEQRAKTLADKLKHERLHKLKCWPQFFEEIFAGRKTFEIRYNDRDYQVGDILYIREYDPTKEGYTGRQTYQKITYMSTFEQKPGFVVLALEKCETFDEITASLEGKAIVKPPKGLMDNLAEAALGAKLPEGYHWGSDAMEAFDFGKHRAYLAVRNTFYDYFAEVKDETEK